MSRPTWSMSVAQRPVTGRHNGEAVRLHPDNGVPSNLQREHPYEGPLRPLRPVPVGTTQPAPLAAAQVSEETAAGRLGVARRRIGRLIAAGLLTGEYGPQSSTAATDRVVPMGWWVDHASLVSLVDAQVGRDDSPTDDKRRSFECASPEEPAVLYGLLTFSDVRELTRRRAKLQSREAI